MKDASRKNTEYIEGSIHTTASGYGFVPQDETGEKADVRIEPGMLNTALNRDTVRVRITQKPKDEQPTGEVIEVLKRNRTTFVGTVDIEKNIAYFIPDDRKAYVDFTIANPSQEVAQNMKVFVELTEWSDPKKLPTVSVKKIIGHKGIHEVEMQSILLEKGIASDFPKKVEDEAKAIKIKSTPLSKDEIAQRRDMRGMLTCTIDPVDAKDFDDAISFAQNDDGTYTIGIHIADVSYYVRPGTALDIEARDRGYSSYLVDRTIPMLPEILSNDLCSLNPNEDKFTYSAIFTLDEKARVLESWFGRTVIHSDRRFSYEDAQKIIDGKKDAEFSIPLKTLNKLAHMLQEKNALEGSIDFGQDEVRFELDNTGKPIRVYIKEHLDTHKLVEQFMLLANRSVAHYIFDAHGKKNVQRAFLYRVHEAPKQEKLIDLSAFLKALSYDFDVEKKDGITGKDLNELFKKIEGTPEEDLIKTVAIRSMQKAAYSTANTGHFGLGFHYYTHFTSPIRRYADLVVHRLLERHLKGEKILQDEYTLFKQLGLELSQKEITIQEAERDSIKYKQVEYMSEHTGDIFDGVISGVSKWGVFIEETTTHAEGLVRLSVFGDDFYSLDEKNYRIVGEKTKKVYALGDSVKIKIIGTDKDKKTIDMELVQ
jgi:ribonuclease R